MNDELILLWQQGASNAPEAAEVARLAARASVAGFDQRIFRRNLVEYLAGVFLLVVNLRSLWTGPYVAAPLAMITGVLFVMLYFWWSHQNTVLLDASANARTYHAAMLAKLDQQLQLLSTVRYWYVLPAYLAILVQTYTLPNPVGQKVGALAFVTLLCIGVIWLNERLGVRKLKAARKTIEALYRDGP